MGKLYLFATSLIFATIIKVSYPTSETNTILEHFNREHKPTGDSNLIWKHFNSEKHKPTGDSDVIWKHFNSETHRWGLKPGRKCFIIAEPIRGSDPTLPVVPMSSATGQSPNKAPYKADTSDTHKSAESTSNSDPIWAHFKPDTSDKHESTESTRNSDPIWAHFKSDTGDIHESTESTIDSDPNGAHVKPETHSPPTIIIRSLNVFKSVEDTDKLLKIPCETTGHPEPTITWKLNNTIISNDSKYSIEDGNLIIKNPRVSDTQSYTCEANNDAGSVSATFLAEILQKPRLSGVMYQIAIVGKPLTIQCWTIRGVPKPEITWQFRPKGGSEYVLLQNSGNVLNIPDVTLNHAGVYKCTARNSVGERGHYIRIDVDSRPIITTNSSVIYKAVEGQDEVLRVPCEATGPPEPIISWHFYGVSSPEISKYSMENGTLIIKNVTVSDSQIYTCKASNNIGSSESMFKVEIVPENMHDTTSLFGRLQQRILRSFIARWFQPTPKRRSPIIVKMGPCYINHYYCGIKCRKQYDECIQRQATERKVNSVQHNNFNGETTIII